MEKVVLEFENTLKSATSYSSLFCAKYEWEMFLIINIILFSLDSWNILWSISRKCQRIPSQYPTHNPPQSSYQNSIPLKLNEKFLENLLTFPIKSKCQLNMNFFAIRKINFQKIFRVSNSQYLTFSKRTFN